MLEKVSTMVVFSLFEFSNGDLGARGVFDDRCLDGAMGRIEKGGTFEGVILGPDLTDAVETK